MTSPLRLASLQKHPSAPPSPDTNAATRSLEANVDPVAVAGPTETPNTPQQEENFHLARRGIPTAITRRLYISHLLSTWNSRSFEFGAVLFLASIFPMTLLPLSIYALVCSASAIIFAPLIGRTIDRRSRLPVVRFSIGKLS